MSKWFDVHVRSVCRLRQPFAQAPFGSLALCQGDYSNRSAWFEQRSCAASERRWAAWKSLQMLKASIRPPPRSRRLRRLRYCSKNKQESCSCQWRLARNRCGAPRRWRWPSSLSSADAASCEYDRYCLSLCFNVHQLKDTSFAVDFSNVHHGKAWVWIHVGGHCKCHQEGLWEQAMCRRHFWVSYCAPKSKQDSQLSHYCDNWDALRRGCAWRCYQGMAGFGSEEVGHGVWRGWSKGGHHVLSCDNTGKEACVQIHVQHCPGRGTESQRWAAGKGSDPHQCSIGRLVERLDQRFRVLPDVVKENTYLCPPLPLLSWWVN